MVFTNPASANDERTFEGTLAEWNALTLVQKTFYTKAIINDDYSDNPVGNLNALTTTDKSSCVGAINEVESGLTNIGNDTDLGNVQGSGTITLSKAITDFRFVQIFVGYYASGYPCFGHALLLVSALPISAEDIPITVAFTDRNETNTGRADISFLSATSAKVVNTSATVYTRVIGIA